MTAGGASGAGLAVLFRAMGGDPGLELVAGTAAVSRPSPAPGPAARHERGAAAPGRAHGRAGPAAARARLPADGGAQPRPLCLAGRLSRRCRALGEAARPAAARRRPPALRPSARRRCCTTFPGLRAAPRAAGRRPSGAAPGTPPAAGRGRDRGAWSGHLTAGHGASRSRPWSPAGAAARWARAPRGYRPFLPSPLWGEVRPTRGRRLRCARMSSAATPRQHGRERAPSARAAAPARQHRSAAIR